jgi:hypothetical protein
MTFWTSIHKYTIRRITMKKTLLLQKIPVLIAIVLALAIVASCGGKNDVDLDYIRSLDSSGDSEDAGGSSVPPSTPN